MAANEYYNPSPQPSQRRSDAPLPPLPNPYSSYGSNQYSASSAASTRYEDTTYRPHDRHSSQSLSFGSPYDGAGTGGRDHDQSPYSDQIPLRPQNTQPGPMSPDPDHQYYNPQAVDYSNDPAIAPRSPRRKKKKQGWFSGKITWAVYFFTLVDIVVFIAEIARSSALTKSPIAIRPQFNPMIGPSPYVLINMGARYVPCMRHTDLIEDVTKIGWPCPNTTSNDVSSPANQCSLVTLCGFSKPAKGSVQPTQWFRFIIPMFLHSGLVHIGFNLVVQVILGRDMELQIGSLRFALVYLASGVFGFVLGGNFAPQGIASSGASGSLFGVIALIFLDLLYNWSDRRSPLLDLLWLLFILGISFVLGLLPGLDNFSHIGGFLMGLILGISILRSPATFRKRIGQDDPVYETVTPKRTTPTSRSDQDSPAGVRGFLKEPLGFFKGRKVLWWAWWLVRTVALIGVLVAFILLLKNFYAKNPGKCGWCKRLSCLVRVFFHFFSVCVST